MSEKGTAGEKLFIANRIWVLMYGVAIITCGVLQAWGGLVFSGVMCLHYSLLVAIDYYVERMGEIANAG